MAGISEAELMDFLRAIEGGEVSLRPEFDPQDIYAGNVSYMASNGWRVTVFNDCNEWDYIDSVAAPDGRSLDFDSIDNHMPLAREYTPSDEVAWRRYGIPGYCTFRCAACSAELMEMELRKPPFLCQACGAREVSST
jgi:DNA-directed RNA polymerase subunit RPC12/RpoP